MRRLFLIDLLVAQRVERFDVAPIGAPYVQRVVDLHLLGEEGIGRLHDRGVGRIARG